MTGRRLVRLGRVLAALVLASLLFGATPGHAQDASSPTLGGYQGTAQADGLHALYNPAGILPIPPPVDLGAPDAMATIASGPATFARASVLDPGDLLADPGALLAQASTAYKAGTIPPYPFRVSATSGVGAPTAESTPAPGLDARVSVGDGTSEAVATMPASNAPAVATLGTLSSTATTTTDGSTVTVHARTQASGFDLLGLVHVDSIVTDLTATSDGTNTKLSGGTHVAGATLAGMPITIDGDGIHASSGAPLLKGVVGSLVDDLDALLGKAGIHLTVAGPVKLEGASGPGQLTSSGLRVDLEVSQSTFPVISQIVKALPPINNPVPGLPSIEDVLALAQARHLVSLDVGRGEVDLAVGGGFPDQTPTDTTSVPPTDLGSTFPDLSTGSTPSFSLPSSTGPIASGGGVAAPVSNTEAPPVPIGLGVGGLVLLALLVQPFLGERIARACGTVLDAGATDTCRWEER